MPAESTKSRPGSGAGILPRDAFALAADKTRSTKVQLIPS